MESRLSAGKSYFLFAIGTLISRVLGLLRESIKAAVFGAGLLNDSFIVAYRIPNLLREMLAEGALGASFTKVFTSLWEEDQKRAKALLVDSIWLAIIAVGILSLLGIVLAPIIAKSVAIYANRTSHGAELIRQATGLTKILFPFILLMSLSAIAAGALHQKGRFFLSSISSAGLNVGFILGAGVFSFAFKKFAPEWIDDVIADRMLVGLAIGVLLGGILQLIILLWGIWKPLLANQMGLPNRLPWSQDLKKVLMLMGPMIIAASASQINIVVNTNFATTLQSGAVTWLSSAFILIHLPVAIFGVAVGSVSLPALSRALARTGNTLTREVSLKLQNSIELVFWLMVPTFVVIQVCGLEIVQVVFQHGKFDSIAANATANTLKVYSYGLLGFSLIKVFTSFYYAIDKTSYAVKVSLISIFLNFIINFYLVRRFEHLGLAATAATVVSLNALFLYVGTLRVKTSYQTKPFLRSLALIALAALVSFVILNYTDISSTLAKLLLPTQSPWLIAFFKLTVNGLVILAAFLISGWLRLGRFPLTELKRRKPR
ncbi:MAG: murein biosynthesis integral membrane protein MurJ [Bdellovibrionota bacterium]